MWVYNIVFKNLTELFEREGQQENFRMVPAN